MNYRLFVHIKLQPAIKTSIDFFFLSRFIRLSNTEIRKSETKKINVKIIMESKIMIGTLDYYTQTYKHTRHRSIYYYVFATYLPGPVWQSQVACHSISKCTCLVYECAVLASFKCLAPIPNGHKMPGCAYTSHRSDVLITVCE